jgi:hypothetical protein
MADILVTERAGISTGTSYVEWAPIIAGAVLAGALSLLLLQFGTAIGLAADYAITSADSDLAWRIVAITIWLFWIELLASLLGGYLAGRMRSPIPDATPHEAEFRDGVHGLLVWATVSVVTIAALGLGSAIVALAPHPPATPPQAEDILRLKANAGMIFAFGATAGAIVSAVAAWWAGTMGGEHRDKAVDLARFLSFRR